MSYSRVLSAFGVHSQAPVTPADLAMCLSLSQRQRLYQLLSMSPVTPPLRCYQPTTSFPSAHRSSSSSSSSSPSPSSSSPTSSSSEPRSCLHKDGGGVSRKRVVFADTKGFALTAVRVFIPEGATGPSALLTDLPSFYMRGSNNLQRVKLQLGFPQPALDFSVFLTRLRGMCVQLESCKVTENSLSGRVCVSHVSPDKVVTMKVTFDSWRSHHDIPCVFLEQRRCGGSDVDVFAFDLSLPQSTEVREGIEFCVCYRPGAGAPLHWDDNRGRNYRVLMEKEGPDPKQPTLLKQRPPSWPSHVSPSPPTHLPGVHRVGAEGKGLRSSTKFAI